MTTTEAVFEDVTAEVGVDFVHFNGMSGEYYFHEMMGSGVALFDYDRDGDLDLYLVQGHMLGDHPIESAPRPPAHPLPLTDRLYRNDLEVRPDGSRRLAFTDVTDQSGLNAVGYGMGVASGDIDNDGWVDLYLTNFGANELWRNRGDGTFEEIGARAGVADRRWSVPATFFDYDRDGWLDLFVGSYLAYSLATHKRCSTELGTPNYCGPMAFAPEADSLFRNRGDGTFEEVTGRAGLVASPGGALGAVASDLDGDGWPDLYVGNDGLPNHMWMNRGDGTFEDEALLGGSALNELGRAEASMGIEAADFDRDGDHDLFVTHLGLETNTYYVNDGGALFLDRSDLSGLGGPSWELTGFGTAALDYDHDGQLDLVVVNGAVRVIEELLVEGDEVPFHQPDLLFRNQGGRRFVQVPRAPDSPLSRSTVSRGLALGDLDNDGDADLVVTTNNGPARVLSNRVGQDSGWVGILALDAHGRPALGARVGAPGSDGELRWREVRTDGSYASARDPRLWFGLGADPAVEVGPILVRWPDGRWEEHPPVPSGRYSTLSQGRGRPAEAP